MVAEADSKHHFWVVTYLQPFDETRVFKTPILDEMGKSPWHG